MNNIKYKHLAEYQFWRFADHLFGNQSPSNRFGNQRKRVTSLVTDNFQEKKVIGTLKKIDRVKNISDYDLRKNYIYERYSCCDGRESKRLGMCKKVVSRLVIRELL